MRQSKTLIIKSVGNDPYRKERKKMDIKYIKTTGVTLMGKTVWDGYTVTVNGKDFKEIHKRGSKWHIMPRGGAAFSLVKNTLKEAKAQIEREAKKFLDE